MLTTIFPFPVFINREDSWFVATCPSLDLATQGKDEKEVKINMKELIEEYLADPDTPKPNLDNFDPPSLTYISISLPQKIIHGKTTLLTSAESN